jgi:hypothetical protein
MTEEELLRLLVRHCPHGLPRTGKCYDGHSLKALLDARKGNWRPGSRIGTKVRQPEIFLKKLPWFKTWVQRDGTVGCTYSAQGHTIHHERFKDDMSERFATQARLAHEEGGEGVLILDDFVSGRSGLRTLSALAEHSVPMSKVYVANPGARQVRAAKRKGAHGACMRLEKALAGPWQSRVFSAAYFDSCSGSVPYLKSALEAILRQSTAPFRLAFTIVGRTSQRFNPDKPACLIARLSALDAFLRLEHGLSKIGRSDEDAVYPYSGQNRVVTVFYERH